MFCTTCGTRLKDDDRFCGWCGTPTELRQCTPLDEVVKAPRSTQPIQVVMWALGTLLLIGGIVIATQFVGAGQAVIRLP